MELTPEERQRIYVEEQARIEARRQIEAKTEPTLATKIIVRFSLGVFGLMLLIVVIAFLIEAAKTPEEVAKDAVADCLKTWQVRFSEKGYSYEDGKLGAALQCSAEIERWQRLKK
jgi:hypothetical protein